MESGKTLMIHDDPGSSDARKAGQGTASIAETE
jgi:hypothetical protein